MKLALLSYHKNANKIYPKEWIKAYKKSILEQTYNDFDIFEIEYGGGKFRIFEKSIYESKELPTFVDAMNYMIKKILKLGYDFIANTNSDDRYSSVWIATQLPFLKYHGYDLVSCNFTLIENDRPIHFHLFDRLDIKKELAKNHNCIAHPAVLYSRKFLENNSYVPEEIPAEDLLLWKRTIDNYRFKIVKENLLYHRIHNNAVCKSDNR